MQASGVKRHWLRGSKYWSWQFGCCFLSQRWLFWQHQKALSVFKLEVMTGTQNAG